MSIPETKRKLIPSPEELKSEIEENLTVAFKSYCAMVKAQSEIQAICDGYDHLGDLPDGTQLIWDVVRCVITEISLDIVKSKAPGLDMTVEVPESLWKHYVEGLDSPVLYEKEFSDAVEETLNAIEFTKIVAFWKNQADDIKSIALAKAADVLVKKFGVVHPSGRVNTVVRAGRIVVKHTLYEELSSYDQWEIKKWLKYLRPLDNETGKNFYDSMQVFINALSQLGTCETFSSRSKFGKPDTLEITVFKTSYHYSFTQSSFEALAAFVIAYSNDQSTIDSYQEFLANL